MKLHSAAFIAVLTTLSAAGLAFADEAPGDKPERALGDPATIEHATPSGSTETAQRLMPFPFTPPDVKLKKKEALSGSMDWYTKKDKKKVDELGDMDFYASSGPNVVGVVPKLHNSSAGIEIYELPDGMSKATYEATEGPFRPGKTKQFQNKRDGKKVAKFKFRLIAESEMAYFHLSRLLGNLVEVPPVTYRTMSLPLLAKVGAQAKQTGNPSCTEAWAELRSTAAAKKPSIVLPGTELAFGALAENSRGENSSPEDYWKLDSIAKHSFYKVLSSRLPVAQVINLADPKSLQDHALAQDMVRGVVLDHIFKQVDRLGNISTIKLQHYVDDEGKVKWEKKLDEKEMAKVASPPLALDRILYKDNDDGMNFGKSSVNVSAILDAAHHMDKTLFDRLQWLSGLMQDSEAGSSGRVRDYFVNAVHISASNYDKLRASVIDVARGIKGRVEKGDIQLDLDFQGTLLKVLGPRKAAPAGGA